MCGGEWLKRTLSQLRGLEEESCMVSDCCTSQGKMGGWCWSCSLVLFLRGLPVPMFGASGRKSTFMPEAAKERRHQAASGFGLNPRILSMCHCTEYITRRSPCTYPSRHVVSTICQVSSTIEFYSARADACSRSPKLLYAVYILVAVAILTDSQIKSWV